MAIPAGRTLFKKKDGILTLTPDRRTLTWTPNTGGPPTVSLPVASITNLQQTPDTSPKVMLKVFQKSETGGDAVPYLFHFNTSEARAEAKVLKDILSTFLTDLRSNEVPRPAGADTPSAASGSASASMAFASAVNSHPSSTRWFDDDQLKADIELQQSLMKKDKSLHQLYVNAVDAKPESVSTAAFNSQFWSSRTDRLRLHAIDLNQKRGAYNVLSTVKPRTVDGELKLNISVEQVQMILEQHPLIKRIYNENVPKISEAQFWSRFFLSRLSKQLRGERVSESERPDPLFDKHDVSENTQSFQNMIIARSVPRIIDVEANEENQGGFRSGNAKDVEMRPRANISIGKTFNSLSQSIMANAAPSDGNQGDPQGSFDTLNQLMLHDLQGDRQQERIMLNVREQNRSFFSRDSTAPTANERIFAKQDPRQVLEAFKASLDQLDTYGPDRTALQALIDFDDESNSDEEEQRKSPFGSRAAYNAAEKEIMDRIRQQRSKEYGHDGDVTSPMGLSPVMTEKCTLAHATTIEFLRQFWNAFLSGDANRALELQYLAQSLSQSATRLAAVADEAEVEREAAIRQRKHDIRIHFERTGKRLKWKSDMVGGGRDAVNNLYRPTFITLEKAQHEYAKALEAEGIQASTE
ncbi:hypothetical protein CDD82_4139 [Ophiocordyceps australis]|uniref:BSD domain-containing protein n=1 Tax=Ophiocordyceps australis TaxID=1399860 RepID=A0A2C5ZA96_9HYPO|nr:hypothetical protein CDD82_4139 [Ophiocordyceps australis]